MSRRCLRRASFTRSDLDYRFTTCAVVATTSVIRPSWLKASRRCSTSRSIASTVSLILAFTAELFLGIPGLGQKVNFATAYGLNDQLYALALAVGFLGLAIHIAFTRIERRALRWHPSQRSAAA